MKNGRKIAVLLVAFLLAAVQLFGQKIVGHKAEVTLYYRFDKSNLDPSYLSNRTTFRTLNQLMEQHADKLDSLVVIAHASPEGNVQYNQALSERRAATMRSYLVDHFPQINPENLHVYARGEDYDGMVRMIEQDPRVPHKKEVLAILTESGVHPDVRVRRLIKLRGGYPFSYVRRNILPYLRTASTCILYYSEVVEQEVEMSPVGEWLDIPDIWRMLPQVQLRRPTEKAPNFAPVVEPPQYTYTISRRGHYVRGDDGEMHLSDTTTLFAVTVREKGDTVGYYKVVAPATATNLTGRYRISPEPSRCGEALHGTLTEGPTPEGSWAIVDGKRAAIAAGEFTLYQDKENILDVEFFTAELHYLDGTVVTKPFEQMRATGDGLYWVPPSKEVTHVTDEVDVPYIDYLVAAKTNLLFDAIGAINIALEIPIGNRFSIDASWTFPWYVPNDWDWCYQLLWGDVEARMWLGERRRDNRLQGHFVGLYAGGGLYDFQWRSTDGYQGEFFLAAGLSYGYAWRLNENWNMEFEVGFGYLQSNYRHYFHITEPNGKETLIRDKMSGTFGYWGPTKAKLSLVAPIEWKVNKNKAKRIDSLHDSVE